MPLLKSDNGIVRYWIVLLAASVAPAQTAGYIGVKACSGCHRPQFELHSKTAHATALSHARSHPLTGRWLKPRSLTRGEYNFRLEADKVRAWDEANVIDLPVEWAFGSGSQAVTFVTRVSREWYLEHHFTYFPALDGFGPTPGQSSIQPETLQQAAGLLYKTEDPDTGILGCFECHTTGPVQYGPDRQLEPRELGVQCEACHAPGSAHATRKTAMENPRRLSAPALNEFCGRCHRPPAAPGTRIDFNYAWNVRHQPVYLAESACFLKSNGRLSCLTCHNAHAPLETNSRAYNARCAGCHQQAPGACSTNCVDCHMPRVSPQPGLRFSNHWIGVYGEGSKLKPVR
jgi:hypothetical protein